MGRWRPPVTLVLPPFLQALGQPSPEKSAAAGPGTARAPRSPRPPGPLPGAPSASGVRSHPVGLRLEPSTCSDTAPGVHPERRGGAAASKKQKKKKTRNGASVANGGGNVSEKPASEEAPLSAEAQARRASVGKGGDPRRVPGVSALAAVVVAGFGVKAGEGCGRRPCGMGMKAAGSCCRPIAALPNHYRPSSWPGNWCGAWNSWSWASRRRDPVRSRVRSPSVELAGGEP